MNSAGEHLLLKDCMKQQRLPAMLREYPVWTRQVRATSKRYEKFLL